MSAEKILDDVSWANLICFIVYHIGKWCNMPLVVDGCIVVTFIALLAVVLCAFRPRWMSGEPVKFRRILYRGVVCACLLVLIVLVRVYGL